MSDKNELPVEEKNENQESGNKKSLLEYYLIPAKNALIFNIAKQHPDVAKFLDRQPGGIWRDPQTGIAVTLGPVHPEIVFSGKYGHGIEIRLDGTGGEAIERGHVDRTRFAPAVNNIYRDGAKDMIDSTLRRFIVAVQKDSNFSAVIVKMQNQSAKKIVLQ